MLPVEPGRAGLPAGKGRARARTIPMGNVTVGDAARDGDDREWRSLAIDIDPVFKKLAQPATSDEPGDAKGRRRRGIRRVFVWIRSLRPQSGLSVFLWALFLTMVAWITASAIDGNLTNSSDSQENLRAALPSLVTSCRDLSHRTRRPTPHSFPFLANSAAWLLAIASAITFGLLLRQWNIMANVVPTLIDSGAIQVKDRTGFLNLIGRLNRIMASRWTTLIIVAAAPGNTFLIYKGFAHNGLYET